MDMDEKYISEAYKKMLTEGEYDTFVLTRDQVDLIAAKVAENIGKSPAFVNKVGIENAIKQSIVFHILKNASTINKGKF